MAITDTRGYKPAAQSTAPWPPAPGATRAFSYGYSHEEAAYRTGTVTIQSRVPSLYLSLSLQTHCFTLVIALWTAAVAAFSSSRPSWLRSWNFSKSETMW